MSSLNTPERIAARRRLEAYHVRRRRTFGRVMQEVLQHLEALRKLTPRAIDTYPLDLPSELTRDMIADLIALDWTVRHCDLIRSTLSPEQLAELTAEEGGDL